MFEKLKYRIEKVTTLPSYLKVSKELESSINELSLTEFAKLSKMLISKA